MADHRPPDTPDGTGREVEVEFLSPHFTPPHFPTPQLLGYVGALVLTLMSFAVVFYHLLPMHSALIVILAFAVMQAGLQLGIFMHLRESRGTAWHLPVLALALFVAAGIVGFSLWIMLFKSGVS